MGDSNKGLWFLAGLGIGAVVGILYAPQSGEETRDLISRKAQQGRDMVKNKSAEIRDQASQYAERGRQAVTRQIDQFQAAVDAGRQAFREATSETEKGGQTGARGL